MEEPDAKKARTHSREKEDLIAALEQDLASVRRELADAKGRLDRKNEFVGFLFRDPQLKWKKIPEDWKTSPQVASEARIVIMSPNISGQRANDILETFPMLRQEREVWRAVISSDIRGKALLTAIKNFAPGDIRTDRELMMQACLKYHRVLSLVKGTGIATDRAFQRLY